MKNYCLILFIVTFFSFNTVISQITYQWSNSIVSTTSSGNDARMTKVDSNGDIYLIGKVDALTATPTIDFYNNTGVNTSTNVGSYGGFINKYDTDGNLLYFIHLTATNRIALEDVVIDSNNDIIVSGFFRGTFTVGAISIVSGVGGTKSSGFLAKYNSEGVLQWANAITSDGYSTINDIAVNSNNEIIVLNYFYGNANLDPGATNTAVASTLVGTTYKSNVNVVKYNTGGLLLDYYLIEAEETGNFLYDIEVGPTNDVYISGLIDVDTKYDFDNPSDVTSRESTYTDLVLLKLHSDLTFEFVKIFPAQSFSTWNSSLSVSTNDEVLIAGRFFNSIDVDPSAATLTRTASFGSEVFIIKLDSDGNYILDIVLNSDYNAYYPEVEFDDLGDIHLADAFNGVVSDPGGGFDFTPQDAANTKYDLLYIHYDNNGNYLEGAKLGEGNNHENLKDLAIDNATGDIYIAATSKSSDFDLDAVNPGNQGVVKSSATKTGAFIAKFAFTSVLPLDEINLSGITLNDRHRLDWKVLSESNVMNYTLEKSQNGLEWELVSVVDSKGDNSGVTHYNSFDEQNSTGLMYYRVRYTDYDGAEGYSNTITMQSDINSIGLYPNPATDLINIRGEDLKGKLIQVFNSFGQIVLIQQLKNETTNSIVLDKLATGVYSIKIENEPRLLKFVKQ